MQNWTELLMADHAAVDKVFAAVEKELARKGGPSPEVLRGALDFIRNYLDACHNRKEEEHLFPLFEARGLPRYGGPLAVMLNEHKQSRTLLAALGPLVDAYVAGDRSSLPRLESGLRAYIGLLKDHIWKENDILYPMGRNLLGPQDDEAVVRGIEQVEAECGAGIRARYHDLAEQLANASEVKDLAYGLDFPTIAAIFNTLPIELSFVDAEDTVRYFSHERHTKIFPRSRVSIGTKVQNCHPQKSVHLVNRILADFKAGTREVAEFWLDFKGGKVHVRYFAVRGEDGRYMGCLETVQDIAPIQALQGERRLLDDAA